MQKLVSLKQVKRIVKLTADHPQARAIVECARTMTDWQAAQLIDILTEVPVLLGEFMERFGVEVKSPSVFNRRGIMKQAWQLYRRTVGHYPNARTQATFGACLSAAWKSAKQQLAAVKLLYLDLNEIGLREYVRHFDSPEQALKALPADRAPAGQWRDRFGVVWFEQHCSWTVISWIAAEHGMTDGRKQYPQVQRGDLTRFFQCLSDTASYRQKKKRPCV